MQITSAISFSCCVGASENCGAQRTRGNVGVSFAEVHESPSSRRVRRNYGTVDSKTRDQPSPSLDDRDCATVNAAGSSSGSAVEATSCDSFVRPAKFYIGTPRDSEGSSIPRTGFAQNVGQRESTSDAEAGDLENRTPTESAAFLSKSYSAETDKI